MEWLEIIHFFRVARGNGTGAGPSQAPARHAVALNASAFGARRLKNLQNQAQALNMKLIPV